MQFFNKESLSLLNKRGRIIKECLGNWNIIGVIMKDNEDTNDDKRKKERQRFFQRHNE